jgi:hypothetical protein
MSYAAIPDCLLFSSEQNRSTTIQGGYHFHVTDFVVTTEVDSVFLI